MIATEYYFIRPTDECQLDAFYFNDENWVNNHNDAFYLGGDAVEQLTSPDISFTKLNCLENDYLSYGPIKLISEKLAHFLEGKIKAKFIPANGFHRGKIYYENKFYILCLLEHIEPLDLEKSVYETFTNEFTGQTFITNLDKIVLSSKKTLDSSAFDMNPLGFKLYRKDICQEILAAGFKGMRFIPIEKYRETKIEDLTPFELTIEHTRGQPT